MAEPVFYPKFSDEEVRSRWQKIRDAMDAAQFDGLLVYGAYGPESQANLRYLTNYTDQMQAYCVFPKQGPPTLLTSLFPHLDTGREVAVVKDMRAAGARMGEKVVEVLCEKELERARIGLVGMASRWKISIPSEHHAAFEASLPGARFAPATDLMERVRQIKSEEELAFLRKGAEISDRAFEAMVEAIRPGVRNIDLYHEILFESHRAGGDFIFALVGSTPMANPAMSFPDAYISDRGIGRGDVTISEHSSSYGGYSGQILRTVFAGTPPKPYERLFEIGLEVFQRIRDRIRPGSTVADVLDGAKPMIDAGLTIRAPLVHGWGVSLEAPVIGIPGSPYPIPDFTFRKGQTIVVEPNPSTPDGKSGIFLGDLLAVTETGVEDLHTHPIEDPIVVDRM